MIPHLIHYIFLDERKIKDIFPHYLTTKICQVLSGNRSGFRVFLSSLSVVFTTLCLVHPSRSQWSYPKDWTYVGSFHQLEWFTTYSDLKSEGSINFRLISCNDIRDTDPCTSSPLMIRCKDSEYSWDYEPWRRIHLSERNAVTEIFRKYCGSK